MTIHLPLLFADGQPTSLDRITLDQLEKFIPFMLSCCPEYTIQGRPTWWPLSVPFQSPMKRAAAPEEWSVLLKQLVCRCYEYHKCEHVLRFCARLAELPSENLRYKETSTGYISIFNRVNNKLIVTFKRKNQIYDQMMASPFKRLLPQKRNQEPPRDQHIEDIYLCNYCDSEFSSGKSAIAHEATCKGKLDEDAQNNVALDQDVAMRYFGLAPTNSSPKKVGTPSSKRGTSVRLTARSYMQVPISSPLGSKMGANGPKLSLDDKTEYIAKVESYCCGRVSVDTSQTRRPRKFGLTFRSRSSRKHRDYWSHTYCFNKAQRKERILTLETGLNKRARLLLKKCKYAVVLLERLPILDPLALHAAASLKFPISNSMADVCSTNTESINNNLKPHRVIMKDPFPCPNNESTATVCIDLTSDDASDDDVSSKENCSYSRDSSDIFFNSSSNHKRPPLHEWSTTQGLGQSEPFAAFLPLPTSSLLPIASL